MQPRRRFAAIALAGLIAAALFVGAAFRPDQAIRVATGLTSHTLCSAAFVSGLPPNEVYTEAIKPTPGLRQLDWALRYTVDTVSKKVTTTWMGRFESQAIYRDGFGCLLVRGQRSAVGLASSIPSDDASALAMRAPDVAGPTIVEPADKALREALDHAFAERSAPPYRRAKAIVVVRDGHVIAERYAAGYGVDTPLLGWSMTKSVMNALVGILVRDGRVAIDAPAPVPEWADPADPRHAITIDQLLRMTTGLALAEWDTGFDPATHMLFLEPDMAAFAQRAHLDAPPGSKWAYTSGNTLILSRIIRDAVGGRAVDVLRFARKELFEPLGMRSVVVEFDAAQTPIGSTYMFATARDWARFGMLYLQDGMIGGQRILPEGWVRYSTTPTVRRGYGAGWWTNREPSGTPMNHDRLGLSGDAFWASGALGQRLVVIPSERIVIARFGASHEKTHVDVDGVARLVRDVLNALHG